MLLEISGHQQEIFQVVVIAFVLEAYQIARLAALLVARQQHGLKLFVFSDLGIFL